MFEDNGPLDRSLRAADADRESAAEILREQHLAGRLDTDELQERLERCYGARTYAELDAVLADLPRQPSRPTASGRARARNRPRIALTALLLLLIAAVVISHGHVLWLALPLAFFFFVIRPSRCGQAWPSRFG